MHILLIPSWYPSTDSPLNGVFFREQALALKRAGHQVGVIAPKLYSLKTLAKGALHDRCGPAMQDDEGVPTYRWCSWRWLPFMGRANAELWVLAGIQLYKRYVEDHGEPNVIHAHSAIFGGVLAARIQQEFKIPTVLTEHLSHFARRLIKPYQHKLARKAFASADRRIVVSPQLGRLLESMYRSDFQPWSTIPNPLNPLFEEAFAARSAQKQADIFRFLHVALLSDNKGQHDLLESFSLAFKENKNIHLAIGGDGEIRESLVRLAQDLEIKEQVKFLGMLDRMSVRSEMLHSNAFVLSSHYETFGIVVIEALACGLPVIATRCGGAESIVTKEDGFLVPPRDPKKLAEAMIQMRNAGRNFNRSEIRERCISRFGEKNVIRQLEDIYAAVTSGAHLTHAL